MQLCIALAEINKLQIVFEGDAEHNQGTMKARQIKGSEKEEKREILFRVKNWPTCTKAGKPQQ